jgi:hypothetical protein
MDTTYGTPDPLKTNIIEALHTFIRSRPGLEYGNYGDPVAYRAEMRGITRDLHDARTLLHSIERAHGITGRNLVDAAHSAFSGRLNIQQVDDNKVRIHYTTGQYYPTEYRRAVAAVAASALWEWVREHCMPSPVYYIEWQNERGEYVRATREPIKHRDAAEFQAAITRRIKEREKAAFTTPPHGYGQTSIREYYKTPTGYISGGDWLRRYFRREFGRGIASRFFN